MKSEIEVSEGVYLRRRPWETFLRETMINQILATHNRLDADALCSLLSQKRLATARSARHQTQR